MTEGQRLLSLPAKFQFGGLDSKPIEVFPELVKVYRVEIEEQIDVVLYGLSLRVRAVHALRTSRPDVVIAGSAFATVGGPGRDTHWTPEEARARARELIQDKREQFEGYIESLEWTADEDAQWTDLALTDGYDDALVDWSKIIVTEGDD